MHIFFTDETKASDIGEGRRPVPADVFIYGGILVPELSLPEFNEFLYKIKDDHKIPQIIETKWRFEEMLKQWKCVPNVDSAIKNLTKANNPNLFNTLKSDYDSLKTEILDFVSSRKETNIVIALRPTRLLKTEERKALEFSLINVTEKVDKVLEKRGDLGLVAADDFDLDRIRFNGYQKIIDLLRFGSGRRKFQKIIWIIPNVISHLSPLHQVNDIILGCISFYIYSYIQKIDKKPKCLSIATPLLSKIIDNFLVSMPSRFGDRLILGSGILIYPPRHTRSEGWTDDFLGGLEKQLCNDFRVAL